MFQNSSPTSPSGQQGLPPFITKSVREATPVQRPICQSLQNCQSGENRGPPCKASLSQAQGGI